MLSKADIIRAYMGVIAAFLLALAFLGVGFYATMKNHEAFGTAVVVSCVVALVSIFIYRTINRIRKQKSEACANTEQEDEEADGSEEEDGGLEGIDQVATDTTGV